MLFDSIILKCSVNNFNQNIVLEKLWKKFTDKKQI